MIQTTPELAAEIAKLRGRSLKARVTINYSSVYGDDLIELSEEERVQRINLYEILICVFEN